MYKLMEREELKARMDKSESMTVVNVLSSSSYEEKHIPGSINIPVDELDSRSDEIPKDRPVIAYCANLNCPASTIASEKLDKMGFKEVYDFKGGVEDWEIAGYELERKSEEESAGIGATMTG